MPDTRSPKSGGRRPASRTSLGGITEADDSSGGGKRLAAHRDVLLQKLAESEFTNSSLRTELLEKDQMVGDLGAQLKMQREEMYATSSLQTSVDATRAHLQKQLKVKEADCCRLAVQIRGLENEVAQDRIELHHIKGLLSAAKDKAERDKDALKKATRAQKHRAVRSEDALERAETQLVTHKAVRADLDDARVSSDTLRKENARLLADRSALKVRLSELEHVMARFEGDAKSRLEATTARLHERSGEASVAMMETDRLRVALTATEDRVVQLEAETSQLRGQLGHYENLVDDYRGQLDKSRRATDETTTELSQTRRQASRVQAQTECQLEKVKVKMETRLEELEPLPELLKDTELRLEDAREQLAAAEKRNVENTRLIAELTGRVEEQAGEVAATRRERLTMSDCTRILEGKVHELERKVSEVDAGGKELAAAAAKKDAAIHEMNAALDERARENDGLGRQLEAALGEARRHGEEARDHAACKDRAAQTRILDLETQLTHARAENARIRRDREEIQKKCNSRLYDLKDRLEQSHASNRSMQNYVQFLKSSYANVFGESGAASSSVPSPIRNGYN